MEPYRGAGPVPGDDGRPLDQIQLLGLTAAGFHGVLEHERRDGQMFVADVVVHLDLRPAAAADDLASTVDYGVLAEEVVTVLGGEPADLVETVAERVAASVLRHERVVAVDVAVHKPHAPVTVLISDVVVAIRRDRTRLPVAALPDATARAAAAPDPVVAVPSLEPDLEAGAEVPRGSLGAPAVVPVAAPATPARAVAAPTDPLPDPLPIAADEAVAPAPDVLDIAPEAPVEVVLALGSNLGAPTDTLREAVTELDALAGVEVLRVSPLARTAAVGGPEQPDFVNAVVIARTTLAPRSLLRACHEIELRHGRTREVHWGPRSLDIDIIVFGDVLAVAEDLELPHPRASQRAFVLQPWAQIAPHAVLPGLGGGPVAALAATAPDRDGIRWLTVDWMREPEPLPAVTGPAVTGPAVPGPAVPGPAADPVAPPRVVPAPTVPPVASPAPVPPVASPAPARPAAPPAPIPSFAPVAPFAPPPAHVPSPATSPAPQGPPPVGLPPITAPAPQGPPPEIPVPVWDFPPLTSPPLTPPATVPPAVPPGGDDDAVDPKPITYQP